MNRDAGTRKGPEGGQTLLKGTDKILIMLKSIPWNLESQLHSCCAKFLPIIRRVYGITVRFFARNFKYGCSFAKAITIIMLLRRRLRRKNINTSTRNKRRFWVRPIYRERKQICCNLETNSGLETMFAS